MSAQLAIVKDESALVDTSAFQQYLKANLTSDLVLQILEECLIEENAVYNSIDFGQALKDIQRQDGGRYILLKTLLEGFATKEGLVMLDPKMVTASYKQRMAQLELLKSMGRFRRFFYRLTQALTGLLTEKNETEAIQEAIQLTGEVQIARNELATLELKKSQAARDADDVLTKASHTARSVIEKANHSATEASEKIFKEGREAMFAEREQANGVLRFLHEQIANVERKLQGESPIRPATPKPKGIGIKDFPKLRPDTPGFKGYSGFEGVSGYSGYSEGEWSEVARWRKDDKFDLVGAYDSALPKGWSKAVLIKVNTDGTATCKDGFGDDMAIIPVTALMGHNQSLTNREIEESLSSNS